MKRKPEEAPKKVGVISWRCSRNGATWFLRVPPGNAHLFASTSRREVVKAAVSAGYEVANPYKGCLDDKGKPRWAVRREQDEEEEDEEEEDGLED